MDEDKKNISNWLFRPYKHTIPLSRAITEEEFKRYQDWENYGNQQRTRNDMLRANYLEELNNMSILEGSGDEI